MSALQHDVRNNKVNTSARRKHKIEEWHTFNFDNVKIVDIKKIIIKD